MSLRRHWFSLTFSLISRWCRHYIISLFRLFITLIYFLSIFFRVIFAVYFFISAPFLHFRLLYHFLSFLLSLSFSIFIFAICFDIYYFILLFSIISLYVSRLIFSILLLIFFFFFASEWFSSFSSLMTFAFSLFRFSRFSPFRLIFRFLLIDVFFHYADYFRHFFAIIFFATLFSFLRWLFIDACRHLTLLSRFLSTFHFLWCCCCRFIIFTPPPLFSIISCQRELERWERQRGERMSEMSERQPAAAAAPASRQLLMLFSPLFSMPLLSFTPLYADYYHYYAAYILMPFIDIFFFRWCH